MRKVVFVTREDASLPGVRVRGYGFASCLAQAGIRAEVFSFADNLGAASGSTEHSLRLRDKLGLNVRAFSRLWAAEALFILQRVHYHSFAPLFVQSLRRRPFMIDLDDWEMREDCSYRWGWYPRSKAEWLTRAVARRSASCLGASTFLCDYLRRFNRDVLFIPTGVDVRHFTPGPEQPADGPVIVSWAGTLHRPDNVENIRRLVHIFLRLRKRQHNIRLAIRGDGRYAAEVRQIVQRCGSPDVILLPWIRAEQMPAYLAQIHIGVMPLFQSSKFNRAKSPTRVFEYMAMAKPVLISDRGDASRIVRSGQDGMVADSEVSFEGMLAELVRDAALRQKLGQRARETVCRRFSLDVVCRPLVEKVRQML